MAIAFSSSTLEIELFAFFLELEQALLQENQIYSSIVC